MPTEYRTVALTMSELRALIRLIEDAPARRHPLEILKRAKTNLQAAAAGPPIKTPERRSPAVLHLVDASKGNCCEKCGRAIAPGIKRCRPCSGIR